MGKRGNRGKRGTLFVCFRFVLFCVLCFVFIFVCVEEELICIENKDERKGTRAACCGKGKGFGDVFCLVD